MSAPKQGLRQRWAAERPPSLYLRPEGFIYGQSAQSAIDAGIAQPFGNKVSAFAAIEVLWRGQSGGRESIMLPAADFPSWLETDIPETARERLRTQFAHLTSPIAAWAGFSATRPLVMGIVNATPDSFSDGGDHDDPQSAITHGLALSQAGADIIDVGGESTRPGALPVDPDTEIARVVPVIRALAQAGIAVSIDSRHTPVMAAAIEAGARIINDVFGLRSPGALALAVTKRVPVVMMHMQGEPETMSKETRYRDVVLDVWDFLEERLNAFEAAGGARAMALIDPGIGFAKNADQNLEIIRALGLYRSLGTGMLLGVSRKRLIEHVSGGPVAPKQRLGGSLALALDGLSQGVSVLRVHDVAQTVQASRLWHAVRNGA